MIETIIIIIMVISFTFSFILQFPIMSYIAKKEKVTLFECFSTMGYMLGDVIFHNRYKENKKFILKLNMLRLLLIIFMISIVLLAIFYHN